MTMTGVSGQFLYDQVKDYLTRELRSGGLGEGGKLPSERTLAESLSISRGTLRIALSELEKSGFIEKLPYKGTFIRKAGDQRPIRLALIFPEVKISRSLGVANYQVGNEVWRGLLESCNARQANLTFLYCSEKDDCVKFGNRVMEEYDGAVFIGGQLEQVKSFFAGKKFPYISVGSDAGRFSVAYDRSEICQQSADFLIANNVKKLLILSLETGKGDLALLEKYQSLQATFKRNGLDINESDLIFLQSDDYERDCLVCLEQLIKPDAPLPDAFFCSSPVISFALLHLAMQRHWKIPEQVKIFGYDLDMHFRQTIVQIPHVRLPHYEIGVTCGDILIDAIMNKRTIPDKTIVKAQLIIS